MSSVTLSRLAQRCPVPWTPDEQRAFDEQLSVLRDDIRDAGGLEPWLEHRLDAWLVGVGPRRPMPHRLARPR